MAQKAVECQCYIQRKAKLVVFNSAGLARTFNFTAGDVGIVPIVAGHYIQNIGDEKLIFVEIFKNAKYSDISLNKWLATNPTRIVEEGYLNVTKQFVESLPLEENPVIWHKKP